MKVQKAKYGMKEYFIYSEIYMTAIGIWPFQSWISRVFFQSIYIFLFISLIIPLGLKIFLNLNDLDIVIEATTSSLYNVALLIKFMNGAYKQKKIASILQKVKCDWESLTDQKEIQILSSHARLARNLNVFYSCFMIGTLLFYMCLPIKSIILDFIKPLNATRPKQAPLMTEYFLDLEEHFYFILSHAIVTGMFSITAVIANDTLIASCVNHACGMLSVLGYRIKRTFEQKQQAITSQSINENYKQVTKFVVLHQHVIQFCDDLNAIYSTPFFFVLSISILMMSMTGMEIVIKLDDEFSDFARFLLFCIGQVFHLFCYNFVGQRLVGYGEEFNDIVFTSDWYTASEKSKTVIKLIIMRSLKPCKLQAIIFPLSLENFTTVMKTSMSYFTVLKSTR